MRKSKLVSLIRLAHKQGYFATDKGEIVSPYSNKPKKLRIDRLNYYRFCFSFKDTDNKHKTYHIPVHQFVAYNYFGESSLKEHIEVRHLDGNPLNNK